MPLILDSHDSLPYIDPQPTSSQLEAASASIASQLSSGNAQTLHPLISASYEPTFSPLISAAHIQIAQTGSARVAGEGIDLSRYEEPSIPEKSSDREAWRIALRTAYISQSYLDQRQLNLSLLERYGKNAWLIGNSQVEDELQVLERELEQVKTQLEAIEEERRQRQDGVRGELNGLEETWRFTVGRAIEAEVAGEVLRQRILERRRAGA